jgi:fumarylacetoacetase
MITPLDNTHNPALTSWVASANAVGSDFPIQNLPFGRFKLPHDNTWRIGVAIGDQVLDIYAARLTAHTEMTQLMSATVSERIALRTALVDALATGSEQQRALQPYLHSQAAVTLGLPCEIGDYTDFYTSIHHATTVGKQFRPDQALMPNYKWVPIGYHGRSSSVVVSGTNLHRPRGQTKPPHLDVPSLIASKRLDYELELGILIGQGNTLGEPICMAQAMNHVFGIALFNDWSARDVQGWEYQPLGPFLGKNFASTLSPWVVTVQALAPFRVPFTRPASDPQPLPYLHSEDNHAVGGFDIELEVWLQTADMVAKGFGDPNAGVCLSKSNYRDAYWTVAQLVTHHTVNGCNLRTGDLLGSGTLSGPAAEQGGSLLELSNGGKTPLILPNGEQRSFLADGDTITLRGYCQREGFKRIGFGECRGSVLPAKADRAAACAAIDVQVTASPLLSH